MPVKLADLNKQIDAAKKVSAEQENLLEKERLDYLRSQTITIGELLDKYEVEQKQNLSNCHWSSPGYYIKKYAEEIILEREN